MSEVTPTRSALIELGDERRAMREGYTFLDEKCLLLAAEIVRELRRYNDAERGFAVDWANAIESLKAAVGRHGLQGLEVYEPQDIAHAKLEISTRWLLGLPLQSGSLEGLPGIAPAGVDRSPEGEACRDAFVGVLKSAAGLAAILGNLARLEREYRHSIRRARALQDVLLPEIDATIAEAETRLEEIEQEDAIAMRRGARVE